MLLIVRLDNVREIIDKTLTTLDKNPQLVEKLLQSVDNTVNTVGGVANTALQPGGVFYVDVRACTAAVSTRINTVAPTTSLESSSALLLAETEQQYIDAGGIGIGQLREIANAHEHFSVWKSAAHFQVST